MHSELDRGTLRSIIKAAGDPTPWAVEDRAARRCRCWPPLGLVVAIAARCTVHDSKSALAACGPRSRRLNIYFGLAFAGAGSALFLAVIADRAASARGAQVLNTAGGVEPRRRRLCRSAPASRDHQARSKPRVVGVTCG